MSLCYNHKDDLYLESCDCEANFERFWDKDFFLTLDPEGNIDVNHS